MGLKTWLGLKKRDDRQALRADDLSPDYYQRLHDANGGKYQANNWLLAEEDRLMACHPETLLEIGFGNARFLRQIAPKVGSAIGLDWVISPLANDLPANVTLARADVVTADLPPADLICSADVLEHFAPKDIDGIIGKMLRAGRFNYHVIACYPTENHLSVFSPGEWLARFRNAADGYRLVDIRQREGRRRGEICVIANY